jgi:hypothetical protein
MNAWALLGIAPTADAAAVRRAHARKLKLTRPDEDPEGFQRLVQARDAALSEAAMMSDRPWEEETEGEAEDEPLLVVADPVGGESTDPLPLTMEPVEPRPPPIIIREMGRTDTPATSAPPIPRIVITGEDDEIAVASHNGFSLEASERHWTLGRQSASQARRLLASGLAPDAELARLIEVCATLPRGPRQEVEAALIEAAGRDLRLPNGRFNRLGVEQVRAIFTCGETVFGWLRDDKLVHTILGPYDAAAFCLIGQEEDDWRSDRRPRIPDGDARVLFAKTRRLMRVYERFRRRGRPSWRFDIFAFPVPPLWAYYYHRTGLAFATMGILTTAGVLMLGADSPFDTSNLAGVGILVATCLGTALLADRFILWGAARTIRRTRNELLYDAKVRADFLRRHGPQPREFITFLIFVLFSSFFLTLPYVGAYLRLQQAAAALAALVGW